MKEILDRHPGIGAFTKVVAIYEFADNDSPVEDMQFFRVEVHEHENGMFSATTYAQLPAATWSRNVPVKSGLNVWANITHHEGQGTTTEGALENALAFLHENIRQIAP